MSYSSSSLMLTAPPHIYPLSLHDALPISPPLLVQSGLALPEHWKLYLPVVLASFVLMLPAVLYADRRSAAKPVLLGAVVRSEEHTSELQSLRHLVCRLLLEKKNTYTTKRR